MRTPCVFLVLILTATLLAREPGGHVEYVGGTRPDLPGGCVGSIEATDEQYLVFWARKTNVRVAFDKINLLEYGQKVDRRYALAVVISPLFLLSKKRQHFLTVGYTDERGQQQALVFRVDKNDVRSVLVSLEARTGLKIQFQDEEARKAGKG